MTTSKIVLKKIFSVNTAVSQVISKITRADFEIIRNLKGGQCMCNLLK